MGESSKEQQSHTPHKKWIACPLEDHYFGDQRKVSRAERKRRQEKDRSKYKKTDSGKHAKGREQEIQDRKGESRTALGRVLSITSQGVIVDSDGILYTCFLRGLLKKERSKHKNLITVGDLAAFEILPDNEGYIIDIEPRKSVLSRADNLSRNKEQLIAANIDQVIITASLVSPELKPSLVDRYIIAARKGRMEPLIVVNKVDLLDDPNYPPDLRDRQRELMEQCQAAYGKAGIPLILLSTRTGEGVDRLKDEMKGKTSVFSGQSGTGKSSLINRIADLNLEVGATVERTRKGAHTTTQARLLPLAFGGWCIDTPGIKSFGVWDLTREEVESYFTEIQEIGRSCKYQDCQHLHERDCAVRIALEEGMLSPLRYESYLALIATLETEHKRR